MSDRSDIRVGDIVRVRLKQSPHATSLGLVIKERRKMFMVGEMIEVMVDGRVFHVHKEHVELVNEIR